eukprot:EW707607.1.p3 GENE.EW707607.1~~EW707607.1.p3  ORF type:complete len:53 (+),score=5.84 EW707607.1:82-240(+)
MPRCTPPRSRRRPRWSTSKNASPPKKMTIHDRKVRENVKRAEVKDAIEREHA